MYHSIPAVGKAERLLKDVDYSDIAALADTDVQAAPSDHQTRENRGKVSRKTRISYEVHTDLLLEEMFHDLVQVGQEDGDGDSDRFGAIVVSMFRMT